MELREIMRTLYGVDRPQGCTGEEIAALRERFGALPAVVEDFWRIAGYVRRLNDVQDYWSFPKDFLKANPPELGLEGYLILLTENQSVCFAGFRREDLPLPDPPVYAKMYDDGPWLLSAPTASEFLEAALLYEAVWQLEYSPKEFYWLSGEDLAVVQAKLEKRPCALRNWMGLKITFYHNRPDNLVVVMDVGDQYQTLYGGATEESCAALREVMEGLGEPL